jgi:hypothetical protein
MNRIPARSDTKVVRRKVKVPNSTLLGFSSSVLNVGDLFMYKVILADDRHRIAVAMHRGMIKPNDGKKWYILAQVLNSDVSFETYERWVEPEDVVRTRPRSEVNKNILNLFEEDTTWGPFLWKKSTY